MDEPAPTFHPSPSRPKLALPKGACDAHCHVFGPQSVFPFVETRTYTPGDAPKETLFALHERLGIERCVIVQAGVHGFDNSAVADAIAARNGACKGIALLPVTAPLEELRRLDDAGFCGVRFNFMLHLGKGASIEEVIGFAERLAEVGWHLQIHLESALVEPMAPALRQSPVPVVIDHMARIDASLGLDQPAFRTLLELMEDDRFWVKVSGCDRNSREGPPYADAVPFARKLVEAFGDRTLWGTDWPHPNFPGAPPDDGVLVDLLAEIAPSGATRHALLVDNPQRLFRFTA